MCKECNKGCRRDVTQVSDQTFSNCMAGIPCDFSAVRLPWTEYNRHFSSQTCFANNKQSTSSKKYICECRRSFATCRDLVTRGNHECIKRYCEICNQKKDIGYLCYVRPMKDVSPPNANKVLYVFYDIETTSYKINSVTAKSHMPNLVSSKG